MVKLKNKATERIDKKGGEKLIKRVGKIEIFTVFFFYKTNVYFIMLTHFIRNFILNVL